MGTMVIDAPPDDLRSIRLKDDLEESWQQVKRLPLAERERFLKSQEAIVGLSGSKRADILRSIEQKRAQLRCDVAGDAWIDAVFCDGVQFPPGGFITVIDSKGNPRRRLALLRLSRQKVRFGEGRPTRRFTPAIAVNVEDLIDGTGIDRAAYLGATQWPESPSARVIQQIESRRGGEASARELRRLARSQKQGKKSSRSRQLEPVQLPPDDSAFDLVEIGE